MLHLVRESVRLPLGSGGQRTSRRFPQMPCQNSLQARRDGRAGGIPVTIAAARASLIDCTLRRRTMTDPTPTTPLPAAHHSAGPAAKPRGLIGKWFALPLYVQIMVMM